MTVHAIEGVFALSELRDGLVVIINALRRLIRALDKDHRAQIIIPAIVTGVTLSVGNGSC